MLSVLVETVTTKENIMPTFKVETQVRENYGAHDWDGTGDCPQYWKSKGGNTIMLIDFATEAEASAFADKHYYRSDDYCHEYVISVESSHADALSWLETCELEHIGRIDFPSTRITPDGQTYGVPIEGVQTILSSLRQNAFDDGYKRAELGLAPDPCNMFADEYMTGYKNAQKDLMYEYHEARSVLY